VPSDILEKVTIRNGKGGPSSIASGHLHGGGIHNHGSLVLVDSALTGNVAHSGGGLTNASTGNAILENVTITGNAAAKWSGGIGGGGIENLGELELFNVTLSTSPH
jgi:hypothetical protein